MAALGAIAYGVPWELLAADPRYPARLRELARPPRTLWIDGRPPTDGDSCVAIVGSRAATRAGCVAAERLAAELACAGHVVISGGALGIDAAAHRGALAAGRDTFAILGAGIDVVYPDRHVSLFREVARRGGLLSEYGPGVSPRRGQFPARNRLVAALARAVIVAESSSRSGALITAGMARALGRPLFAVPGSAGGDSLLRRGLAWPVTSAKDVDAGLCGVLPPPVANGKPADPSAPAAGLGPMERVVAAIDELQGAAPDALARRLGMLLPEVLAALAEAELAGDVVRRPGGRFEVPRG